MYDLNELISVIVPVYNVEEYLERCFDSIIEQTYSNIEIILVNDGSLDNSGILCDKLKQRDERVKVIHKTNGGLSDARNVGLENASGEYVIFVDSDDLISIDMVSYLYSLIDRNKADIGICDLAHCYLNGAVPYKAATDEKIYSAKQAITEMLLQRSFLVSACAKIFPKRFFDYIKFPVGMLYEDVAIMPLLFEKADKIAYGDACLYGYMHRENSITTKKFNHKDLDIIEIANMIQQRYVNDIVVKDAALAYWVNANLRIYLNAPHNEEYENVIDECSKVISKNAIKCILNIKTRRKLKCSLLLFLFSKKMLFKVYSRVNRWA